MPMPPLLLVMFRIPLRFRAARLAIGLVLLGSAPAFAQDAWDPSRVYASRISLDSLARRFELAAESPAYSEVLRAEARGEAGGIRSRLESGDFQVGDRIVLVVEEEAALSDSFVVEQGPLIRLPTMGVVNLAGVLRSELEAHLTRELGRYIRDPVVQARTSIRITVTGEVSRPGFYAVASDLLVTDVLAQAGQITAKADLGNIRIERGNQVLWDNQALGPEIIEGRTLDQLGVRAGDRITVGGQPPGLGSFESSTRVLIFLLTIPGAVAALVALFN